MAQRPFIVLGDGTSHGGTVVEASQVTFTHNKPIARVGDKVTCPIPGHGTTVIVEGDPTMILDGKPVARHGDKCACGAVLISSQVVSTIGNGGASNPQAASAAQADSAAQLASKVVETEEPFDDRFRLIDSDTGEPLTHTEYAVVRADGSVEHGSTDGDGYTHLLTATAQQEHVTIYA